MTTEHEATRTLVKSPPELWAECSDAASLARHLGEFGDIKITRLEPETAVAWEGERASGTVRIEPSAWGTRVTLTAQMVAEVAVEEASPVMVEEPVVVAEESAAVPENPVGTGEPIQVAAEEAAAIALEEPPVAEEPVVAAAEVPAVREVAPAPKQGLVARLRAFLRGERAAEAVAVAESTGPEVPAAPQVPPEAEAQAKPAVPPEAEPRAEPEVPDSPTDPKPPAVAAEPEPGSEAQPAPELTAPALGAPTPDPEAVLAGALDSLGQAHHRPFSRA